MDPYRDAPAVGYIRYFACTDASAIGLLALELCTAMRRVAPVRTVTMTGVFVDQWFTQMATMMTPTPEGAPYVNVVACDPSRWTWTQRIPMPDKDAFEAVTQGMAMDTGKVEMAVDRMSLYTEGVRNVLYAVAVPRSQVELATARQFEQVVVPNETHQRWWKEHGGIDAEVLVRPHDDEVIRRLIVGPPK